MGAVLYQSPYCTVNEDDLSFSFSLSGGPGGQNVNKTSTAAELRVRIEEIRMAEPVRSRFRITAASYFTDSGDVLIRARTQRTQRGNRQEAIDRLITLIRRAEVPVKTRKATKPTHASRERRIEAKKAQSDRKQNRRRIDF